MVAQDRAGRVPPSGRYAPVGIHEYLIEEDELGDSTAQTRLLGYLEAVLQALLGLDGPFVARNLSMYHPAIQNSQNLISPDIAIFLGIPLSAEERLQLKSWDMRLPAPQASRPRSLRRAAGSASPPDPHPAEPEPAEPREPSAGVGRPCPPVMIEVSSPSTWRTDIDMGLADKVVLYGRMGVQLYLAYDPNQPQVWRRVQGRRLLGWRYTAQGVPQPLAPDERGWLWCAELDSWAGDDGYLLRLYDPAGHQRLTAAEQAEARAETLLCLLQDHGIDPGAV